MNITVLRDELKLEPTLEPHLHLLSTKTKRVDASFFLE